MGWLFPAYITAVAAALLVHHNYRKRHPRQPVSGFLRKVLYKLAKALCAIAIVYAGGIIMILSAFINEYYLFFTPSRCDNITRQTGIIIGDDVTPVKYCRMSGAPGDGCSYRLELRTELSISEFMENCCSPDCGPCGDKDDSYRIGRKIFSVKKEKGLMVITH